MVLYNIIPRKKNNALRNNDPFFGERFGSLFDEFFGGNETALAGFTPRLDVSENDKELTVEAELPGMDEKDVKVSLEDGLLTIEGEKKEETEKDENGYHHVERSYGSFRRTIPFDAKIDEDKVKAKFKKGVLSITMPKAAEAKEKAKRIQIGN